MAVQPALASRLTSDFRTAINDKPLRDALQSIAESRQINYWLDRHVDPTTPVTTTGDIRSAYQAIAALAQSAGVEVAVVDNIVLVGRPAWVERTAAATLSAPTAAVVDEIAWPAVTTPTQAAMACDARAAGTLPHDLWPAVRWTEISPSVAHLLVAAQFDLEPSTDSPTGYAPLQTRDRIAALYPTGPQAKDLRSAIAQSDPRATIKEVNSQLLVSATIAAHRAATAAWLGRTTAAAQVDIDKVKFSLQLKPMPAERVFGQLASTAGRQLVIQPEAAESCQKLVSFTAKDRSLRELVDNVAVAANVTVVWTPSTLTVHPRN